ncbi:MAG: DoxX family protein [Solirubrobacterales bacterium]
MADTVSDFQHERLLVPALAPIYRRLDQVGWTLVRFATGAALIPHGWGKLIGGGLPATAAAFEKMGLHPGLATYIGILELIGGTCLALGLLTRFWAAQVVGFMAVATFYVHWSNGYQWTNKGWEYPAFWMIAALAVLIRGAGPLSIDRLLPREL